MSTPHLKSLPRVFCDDGGYTLSQNADTGMLGHGAGDRPDHRVLESQSQTLQLVAEPVESSVASSSQLAAQTIPARFALVSLFDFTRTSAKPRLFAETARLGVLHSAVSVVEDVAHVGDSTSSQTAIPGAVAFLEVCPSHLHLARETAANRQQSPNMVSCAAV